MNLIAAVDKNYGIGKDNQLLAHIPEDMKYTSDIKFEKKGNSWAGAIIFSLIMVVVFVAILVALPHIFELLNDLAGSIDTTPDNII